MNIFNQINQNGMKTIFNKVMVIFMTAFACLLVVSCESKDSDTIQAELKGIGWWYLLQQVG